MSPKNTGFGNQARYDAVIGNTLYIHSIVFVRFKCIGMYTRFFLIAFLITALLVIRTPALHSQQLPSDAVSPSHIVWLKAGTDPVLLQRHLQAVHGEQTERPEHLGFGLYLLRHDLDPAGLAALRAQPYIRYAGINRQASLRGIRPNDPEYGNQWHHELLGSERAWEISTGGKTVDGHTITVAVMDAGFERTHEDIQPSLWINAAEIPDDGIDNDNNGYIDDFDSYNPRQDNGAVPVHIHGQSVAGYIGARGNNGLGVSGLSWEAELMLLAPTLQEADIIRGFHFLYDWRHRFNVSGGQDGAYIPAVNMSLGFDDVFPQDIPWMCPLIDSLHEVGILVVAAGPNAAVDVGVVGDMPCLCPNANIICVTNTTRDDNLVSNAAISKTFVHLSAPGFQSYTTRLGQYGLFSGTSAAAPMVTGAIGLLAALPCDSTRQLIFDNPRKAASILRQAILEGVVPVRDLKDLTVTGGRLSLWSEKGIGAVPALANLCGSAEGPVAILDLRPNPADQMVTVYLRSPGTSPFPVRVYNMLGQLLWEQRFEPESFEPKLLDIPVAHWPAGMYVVTAGNGKALQSARLLIHH